jgi:hypothetical protein
MEQKNNLYIQLQTEQDTVIELEERVEQLVTQKADFEAQMFISSSSRARFNKGLTLAYIFHHCQLRSNSHFLMLR